MHYFASLPEGFAPARAAAGRPVCQVQAGCSIVGVAGTAGKTAAAAPAWRRCCRAAGLVTGCYHAGCEPLSARIRVEWGAGGTGAACTGRRDPERPRRLCPVQPPSWLPLPAALARQAVRWLWWSCRMRGLPRPCPRCRSVRSQPSARTASAARWSALAALAAGVMRKGSSLRHRAGAAQGRAQ